MLCTCNMKNVLCSAEKSSVVWAEPHSRSLAEQFGRTECLVDHYILNCNLMQKPQFKYDNSLKIKSFDNFNFWNSLFWIWAFFCWLQSVTESCLKKLFDFIKLLFWYLCLTASNKGCNIWPPEKFGPQEIWATRILVPAWKCFRMIFMQEPNFSGTISVILQTWGHATSQLFEAIFALMNYLPESIPDQPRYGSDRPHLA